MPTPDRTPDLRRNLILRGLPDDEYARLASSVERVDLEVKDLLYEAHKPFEYAYFPVDCVLSLLSSVDGEAAVEVATIGYEGVSGLPAFLGSPVSPHDSVCQVAGTALRLSITDLRTFLGRDGALHDLMHRYTQAMMVQLSQNVACNRLHTTEERCARWLLQTRDRVGVDDFGLTQEFLAQMLGVRRGTVSLTAGVLQQAGLIRYSRGRISVVDAEALHGAACECYDLVQAEFARLIGAPELAG
ncbi:Crp/Fnr family transcriptional regulator [Geodermatophilus sp. DF01-2]|uniref:Crp/Fnr family transcriptional regulator n=1 Tax=Geodermatophilus sp. DF01-2 TaxID=2559610 RepID=UPI00107328E9|nr:Crp/Fnr family transcriptional regulator [Geodermatophilus sp. DF01_2]TFV57432.1 Crp/Fnr family transcriptional regulator [Geodermatophilus sp. DF01_2]